MIQELVTVNTTEDIKETSYEDDGLMDDYQYALNVCIQGKMCAKGQYTEWLKIKTILKNELGDDGMMLFVEWSSHWGNLAEYKTLKHKQHCENEYKKQKPQKNQIKKSDLN